MRSYFSKAGRSGNFSTARESVVKAIFPWALKRRDLWGSGGTIVLLLRLHSSSDWSAMCEGFGCRLVMISVVALFALAGA